MPITLNNNQQTAEVRIDETTQCSNVDCNYKGVVHGLCARHYNAKKYADSLQK